jgi:transcriptional regulator with XRE-family HTH domain
VSYRERLGLAERLRAARKRRDLRQIDAAREIGLSRVTIARIEIDYIAGDRTRARVRAWVEAEEEEAAAEARRARAEAKRARDEARAAARKRARARGSSGDSTGRPPDDETVAARIRATRARLELRRRITWTGRVPDEDD